MRHLPFLLVLNACAPPLADYCNHYEAQPENCDMSTLDERFGDELPDTAHSCGRFVVVLSGPDFSGADFYYRERDGELVAVHYWTDVVGHDTWYGRQITCK